MDSEASGKERVVSGSRGHSEEYSDLDYLNERLKPLGDTFKNTQNSYNAVNLERKNNQPPSFDKIDLTAVQEHLSRMQHIDPDNINFWGGMKEIAGTIKQRIGGVVDDPVKLKEEIK